MLPHERSLVARMEGRPFALLGVNCDAHLTYLIDTLRFADKNPGFQELLRNTVAGLVAMANAGNVQALP